MYPKCRLDGAGIVHLLFLILSNSPLEYFLRKLLGTSVVIQIAVWSIDKPLSLWINDGLMAVFFFWSVSRLSGSLSRG